MKIVRYIFHLTPGLHWIAWAYWEWKAKKDQSRFSDPSQSF